MAVVLALPRYAVFRNLYNLKNLSFRKDDMYLSFTGDSISPEAKFAIEPASSGNGQVHVRSAYNNKYLVRNSTEFLIAGATKPEEDATKDTCTLLEPLSVYDGDTSKIRFRHVYSGNYACLYYSGSAANLYDACLHAVSPSPNSQLEDAYEVIDWETLVIFPTHSIAFKGSNGYYLGGIDGGDLQFSVVDKYKENASFRVESLGNGYVQVFSNYFSKYWTRNYDNWIYANGPPDGSWEIFWPIKLDSNVIALRTDKRFVRGLDGDKPQCLNAAEESITTECHLTVDDLVISRSIYNSVYRLEDARIYDETPIFCGKGTATNGSDAVDTIEIPITYTEAKTSSWEDSGSLTLSVGTTFETGVPFIAEGKVSFDTSATGTHTWGGTTDESFETGVTYTATIPPRKIVTVTYISVFDFKFLLSHPFSYTLDETYSDGSHNITVKDDGLFTGVNCYSFSFDVKETPI